MDSATLASRLAAINARARSAHDNESAALFEEATNLAEALQQELDAQGIPLTLLYSLGYTQFILMSDEG